MENNKKILALDLGTKTGWAINFRSTVTPLYTVYGIKDFSNKRFEGGGMRYLKFREWIKHIFSSNFLKSTSPIDEVYFEEVNHSGWKNSAAVYGGFLATLTSWCEEHKIPYQGVPVKTIKKFITGNGNADKLAVIEAVKARGFEVEDHNIADAIALLSYVIENRN